MAERTHAVTSTDAPAFTPGVYDMAEATYHADPVPGGSLSVSGAKKLLPPSCPARYAYDREHPPEPKPQFDFGTAAHRLVLGKGADYVLIDAPDWRTKAAKEARDEAHAAGHTPLLLAEFARVEQMAAAIRGNPLARALLCRDDLGIEQSFFWQDHDYGIWRRARLDAYGRQGNGVPVIVDYKTAESASPGAFARAAASFGYHMQHAWYVDAVLACLGIPAAFLFVVQEKTPPYLVTVCELDAEAVEAGAARNRAAMERYRDCVAIGDWPGYSSEIETISLPAWALKEDYL